MSWWSWITFYKKQTERNSDFHFSPPREARNAMRDYCGGESCREHKELDLFELLSEAMPESDEKAAAGH